MSIEENKQLVRRFYDELWNNGNLDVIDQYTAADMIEHESEYADQLLSLSSATGLEGLKQTTEALRQAFPDVRFTVEDQIAEGDKVLTRWQAVATQSGSLGPLPPSGKHVTATGVYIDRIANGKIVEEWEEWDVLGFLMQLGLIPAREHAQ